MRKIVVAVSVLSLVLSACTQNNVTDDESLKQYFDKYKVTGTFAFFDNSQGEFTIYNVSRFQDSAYLPASTFKIVNSLIAIETGVVNNDSAVIPWNGRPFFVQACNADLPMYQAFRNSCVPWFQELARRIGKDTMQTWIDSLGYGSRYGKVVIQRIDTFWLDNSVKVTADEQLGLVKKLYFDQLPFKKWTQLKVKNMMKQESNDKYTLAYKTGWGRRENGNHIGWIVGWIEENRHPFPFVLQLESENTNFDMAGIRMNLLNDILKHYGFREGKK
jgi:beta-lactamase class D